LDYIKVGKITHFFDNISVAVLVMTDGSIKVGDMIRIGEVGTGVEQKVESMQVDHKQVDTANKGEEVGLKVSAPVKEGDVVYKPSA